MSPPAPRLARRAVVAALGAAFAGRRALAQPPALPVVGVLGSASASAITHHIAAFVAALAAAGFVEGRTVAFAWRWAENRYERLPALAAELVRLPVAVIATSGGPVSALAAKAATATIPVVFASASDPVESGLVASLSRPGGNVTGIAALTVELDAKRLEVIRELVPGADPVGVLVNTDRPQSAAQIRGVRAAADQLGIRIALIAVDTGTDLDAAFAAMAAQRLRALMVAADPFFNSRRDRLAALAARHRIAAVYQARDYVEAGGLMSYGTDLVDTYRQAAVYVARILRGERPADLPVVQPTTVELVVNAGAARALGLAVPAALLARADAVIE